MGTTNLSASTRNEIKLVGGTALMASSRSSVPLMPEIRFLLLTGLQPIPPPGRERTKNKRELRVAMQWVIDRCPDGGHQSSLKWTAGRPPASQEPGAQTPHHLPLLCIPLSLIFFLFWVSNWH
jgi:hypothetical protein